MVYLNAFQQLHIKLSRSAHIASQSFKGGYVVTMLKYRIPVVPVSSNEL